MDTRFQFQVFPSSGVPIYRQLIDQIVAQIGSGRLQEGDLLPSARETAAELEINPMTVSKAYSQLEQRGILELVRGKGMRVREREPRGSLEERKNQVRPHFEQALAHSYQLSLSRKDVLDVLEPMLNRLETSGTRKEKSHD